MNHDYVLRACVDDIYYVAHDGGIEEERDDLQQHENLEKQ